MTTQLQRTTPPTTPHHRDVVLTFRYEQVRLLEMLVQEGIEIVHLNPPDQDRAADILNVISDGRRHTESLSAAPQAVEKTRGARR